MTDTTYFPKPDEIERKWQILDAKEAVLGRLAARIATLLIGKNKIYYTPNRDCGDFVIVTNAKQVRLTGNKFSQKTYFHHSNYPGGAKFMPFSRLVTENPVKIIELAVSRMLPKNKLRARMLKRLRIFPGAEHLHQAQKPIPT